MKLKKAIEINNSVAKGSVIYPYSEIRKAAKLGSEALKRVEVRRDMLSWKFEPLLPSETTE